MAQQATLKRGAAVEMKVPEAPKTRAAKAKVFDYSRSKIVFQKTEDFYTYLAGYPDKTGLMGYVYRLRPRIDLSLIGISETSIHQSHKESELTEEWVSDTFGRGFYMVKLSDANRPKGLQQCCSTWFDCELAVKPAVYDVRTLCIGESKNADEITRLINAGVLIRDTPTSLPRLRSDGDAPAPVASAGPAAAAAAHPFGSLDLSSVLVGLINRGAGNSHDNIKDMIEMAKLLHPPQPVFDMEAVAERVAQKLGRAPDAGAAPLDLFAAYDKVDRFMQRVRGDGVPVVTGDVLQGDGAAPVLPRVANGGGSWAAYLPGILSEVRGLIPEAMNLFREMREEPRGRQTVREAAPMNAEEVLKLGFRKMNEGVNGFDYAAWLVLQPGGITVFSQLDSMGGAALMGVLAMNPVSAPMIQSQRPQVEKFLDEFFSYSVDPVEGDETAAAAGGSAGSS